MAKIGPRLRAKVVRVTKDLGERVSAGDVVAVYGISLDDVLKTVETGIGGSTDGQVFEGIRRFDVFLRLKKDQRDVLSAIKDLPLRTAKGALIPLSRVADVEVFVGPKKILRDEAKRRIFVQLNVRGRDMGTKRLSLVRRPVQAQGDLRCPDGLFAAQAMPRYAG